MVQALVVKLLFKQIMKAIEKTSDKRIASGHEKRIKALEKDSHPRAGWICMKCGCKAKKVIKNKSRRK